MKDLTRGSGSKSELGFIISRHRLFPLLCSKKRKHGSPKHLALEDRKCLLRSSSALILLHFVKVLAYNGDDRSLCAPDDSNQKAHQLVSGYPTPMEKDGKLVPLEIPQFGRLLSVYWVCKKLFKGHSSYPVCGKQPNKTQIQPLGTYFTLNEVANDLVVEVLDGCPSDSFLYILLLKKNMRGKERK